MNQEATEQKVSVCLLDEDLPCELDLEKMMNPSSTVVAAIQNLFDELVHLKLFEDETSTSVGQEQENWWKLGEVEVLVQMTRHFENTFFQSQADSDQNFAAESMEADLGYQTSSFLRGQARVCGDPYEGWMTLQFGKNELGHAELELILAGYHVLSYLLVQSQKQTKNVDFDCWTNPIECLVLQHSALHVMCWEDHDSGMTCLSLQDALFYHGYETPSLAEHPNDYLYQPAYEEVGLHKAAQKIDRPHNGQIEIHVQGMTFPQAAHQVNLYYT